MTVDTECQATNERRVTIGLRVSDLIEDAAELKKEQSSLKFKKHEMLPPLTAGYRQSRAIREVEKLQLFMKKQIEECDINEIERQSVFDQILNKCTKLKESFGQLEGAICELEKQKETHHQIVQSICEEMKESEIQIKRFIRASSSLASVSEMMQWVIEENTCYGDFLDQVANDSKRYNSAAEITGRFETLLSVKKLLNDKVDWMIEKMETARSEILAHNFSANDEQNCTLQRLQSIDYELNAIKMKTTNYERALNDMNVESVQQQVNLNLTLKSVEQMVDNMIQAKILNPECKKMTLAQQLEAIRKDYLMKKAILKEYQRSNETKKSKKEMRFKAFEDYEEVLLKRLTTTQRLEELHGKKRMANIKKQEIEYGRRLRRMRSRIDDDFFEDASSSIIDMPLVDLEAPVISKTLTKADSDDFYETDEEMMGDPEVLDTYDDTCSHTSFEPPVNDEQFAPQKSSASEGGSAVVDIGSYVVSSSSMFSGTSLFMPKTKTRLSLSTSGKQP